MTRPTQPPALLIYVNHASKSALVQGTGALALLSEVFGTRGYRSTGMGAYALPSRKVPAVVGCARAWGGSVTLAHIDGKTCDCWPNLADDDTSE